MADGGEHPADLTVATFIEGQLQLGHPGPAGVFLAAYQADILRGACHTVVQQNALADSLQIRGIGYTLHRDSVSLRDMITRVRQLKQKIAVVGQKDQSFTVGVETPHGPQHRLPADVYEFRHETPRMRV